MGVEKIQKGDVGTVIEVLILQAGTNTPEDVSDATTIKLKIRLKDDTIIELDGSFVTDGTDGLIKATSTADTFTVGGDFEGQVYLENAGGTKKHHTTAFRSIVNDVLS